MIQMSLIQRKYLLSVKNNILQKLRSSFKPLEEQEAARRIIAETHKHRVKTFIWRKWRSAAKESEFETTRKFEFQNILEKIG
jgi:hypothetical protein